MVLRTTNASSQLSARPIPSLEHTWCDAAFDELVVDRRHVEGGCCSRYPENGPGRHSYPHSMHLMPPLFSPAVMRTAGL